MSALRVYAETGTRLLNTGADVDDDTDTIRRLHKTGVELHYESDLRRLRCYAQVRRTPTSSPEQVIFEYDPDPGADVFEAFVRDAEAAMEDASWQVLSDNSPAYEALKRGRQDTPDPIRDVAVGFKHLLKQLDEHGKRIDLVATDDGAGTGLARYVHGEFDGGVDVAIAGTGRTASVISDVDVVIVPGGSHTGVPERTVDRFKQIQLDEQTERLGKRLDELSGRMGLDGLAAHLENEVIEPEEGITLRPPSARSWWKPDRGWLLGAVAVGLLAVVVYGGWTNRGRTVELLTRRVSFVVPGWIPGPVRGVVPSGVGLVSWWIVLAGSLAAVVSLGAVFVWRSRVGGSVEIEGSDGGAADDTAAQLNGDDDTVETDVNAPLAAIGETADRETRTERLVDALEDRGIEVVSSDRTRKRYRYGPRLTGVAIALAVTVGLFVLNPIAAGLAVVEASWFLILEGVVALAAIAVGGGVVLAVLAARKRVVAAGRAVRRRGVAALATVRTKAKTGLSPGSVRRGGDEEAGIGELRAKMKNENWGYFTLPELDDLLETLENDRNPELAELLLEVDEKSNTYPRWDDGDRELAEEVAAESGSEGTADPRSTDASGDVTSDTRSTDASGDVTSDHQPASTADSPKDASDTEPERSGDDFPGSIDRLGGTESTGETATQSATDGEEATTDDDGEAPSVGVGETTGPSATDGEEPTTDDGETRSGGAAGTSTASEQRFSEFRYDAANTGHVRGGGGRRTEEPRKGWDYATDAEPLSPLVANGTVYVVDSEGNVYALDAETGDKRWTTSVDDDVTSVPTVRNEVVYFGSKNGTVYAVDGPNGPKWSNMVEMGGYISNPATLAPPTVQDGQVFIGDRKGGIHALDAMTGDRGWHKQLGDEVWGKPAYRDGSVYAVSGDGQAARFDTQDGDKQIGVVPTDARITTTPALSGTDLFVIDGGGELHRLKSEYQKVGNSWSLDSGPVVPPTVGDELVFVGAKDGRIAAVDTGLRNKEWESKLNHGGELFAPFVLGEETLYVVAGRWVYALDPTSGDTCWDLMLGPEIGMQPALTNDTLFVTTERGVQTIELDGE